MKIMGLDTSRKLSEVSILDTATKMLVTETCMEKNNESLLRMIDGALKRAGCRLPDIDLIGASVGPGSFTGLRIGLTTVKTFSQLLNIPVIGVGTFAAMAQTADFEGTVLIDARGGRVYYGDAKKIDDEARQRSGPRTTQMASLIPELRETVLVLESESVQQALEAAGIQVQVLEKDAMISPAVAQLALSRYEHGEHGHWTALQPEYVGVSQAERELEQKQCRH